MNKEGLLDAILEVPNAIAVVSCVGGILAGWAYMQIPRRIGINATAPYPFFRIDPNKLPFIVKITNTNTRQFKISNIGFEVFGRYEGGGKACSYEVTLSASLLQTDKLLITEGDTADISFDGYVIARQLADGIRNAGILLTSTELKVWLYLTHGRKVLVELDRKLSDEIVARIVE